MTNDITSGADIIDVRDIIARVEELRSEREDSGETHDHWAIECADEAEELATLEALLNELKGYGGDEQWEGDWYPITLIRDSYFETAMDEMLEDCGDMPKFKDIPSYLKITVDYDALQQDYSSVEYDGETYWYR